MTSLKLLKKEVINLKENLESIECDDHSLNKLYDRVYSLKMSLLNVDKELSELNFLTKKDIQRSQSLLVLKDFYRNELRSLEMISMSEKRFTGAVDSNGLKSIFDDESEDCNEPILFNCIGIVDEVVDLLNEQQATIKQLEKENEQLRKVIDNIYDSYENYWGMSLRNAEWLEDLDNI